MGSRETHLREAANRDRRCVLLQNCLHQRHVWSGRVDQRQLGVDHHLAVPRGTDRRRHGHVVAWRRPAPLDAIDHAQLLGRLHDLEPFGRREVDDHATAFASRLRRFEHNRAGVRDGHIFEEGAVVGDAVGLGERADA